MIGQEDMTIRDWREALDRDPVLLQTLSKRLLMLQDKEKRAVIAEWVNGKTTQEIAGARRIERTGLSRMIRNVLARLLGDRMGRLVEQSRRAGASSAQRMAPQAYANGWGRRSIQRNWANAGMTEAQARAIADEIHRAGDQLEREMLAERGSYQHHQHSTETA